MTDQQRAFILLELFNNSSADLTELLNTEMLNFGLSEEDINIERINIEKLFNYGIKNLNKNQLNNLLNSVIKDGFNEGVIKKKLKFYEINGSNYENILPFFKFYNNANKPVEVGDLDVDFKGVQVATRDDFNMVINQGYTGDWVLKPESIKTPRVQIASMNENGHYPRGFYINADITNIKPVAYGDQTRYRIFIVNPVVINTGNRNVKFNMNPVKYIE